MNVKYYPSHLTALIIDGNLAMGAHDITLDAAQTVDGVDVSIQKTNMDNLIRQMHPNVSILAAMDDATLSDLQIDGVKYNLVGITTDVYDAHDDSSVDTNLWTIVGDVTEDTTHLTVSRWSGGNATHSATSIQSGVDWYVRARHERPGGGDEWARIYLIGATEHAISLTSSYADYLIVKVTGGWDVYRDNALIYEFTDANATCTLAYRAYGGVAYQIKLHVEQTEKTGTTISRGVVSGNMSSDAIAANAAVISFFSHLKGKFSNGGSSHANPVQVEIFGNGDSYAAALNGTTKFKIDVADPMIELYRIDNSVVAKSNDQTNWTLDDDASTGAFAAKTTSTHETILGEEIGCASVVMVEKSVNGAFTDTEILVEDDDYTVDYSTRTATKIVLTTAEAADIVISQSKLRITWIADVEDIEGTANTAIKMKIYLNRTDETEASPEIQKIDIGTDKYAEMQYVCG